MVNWAIAIGINSYDNLQDLKYAKQDAEAMKDWFEKDGGFDRVFLFTEDSPPIPGGKGRKPIPTTPTYARLRRFLSKQFENPLLEPGDNLWFFFAGHGRRHENRDYLMLSDSDPSDIEGTAIAVSYATERLRKCGSDNVLLFLDACRDSGSRSGFGIGQDFQQGVITFYSCSPNEQSWEIEELQLGSFTSALLSGLRNQGGNCATVKRLDDYIGWQVPALNKEYKKPSQNPYTAVEPLTKQHFILLPEEAIEVDIVMLKTEAFRAEIDLEFQLAKQLWRRVNEAARGTDREVEVAFERIALKAPSSYLAEAVTEIEIVAEQLKSEQKKHAIAPTNGYMHIIASEVIDRIEKNPELSQRILKALGAGTASALESFLGYPTASFVLSALEGWRNSKQGRIQALEEHQK